MTMKTEFHPLTGERTYTFTHKSGLTVCLIPKPMKTYFALLGSRFGSVNRTFTFEGAEHFLPDGTAHFLEHKLFENEDGEDALEKFGRVGADSNAFTTALSTAYLFDCTENFEASLEILLKFVTSPYFTQETVEKELGIIDEEIAADEDAPGEVLYDLMLKALYKDHPVRRPILGDKQSIRQITPEILYRCHRAFYQPSNLILTLSGDLTPEAVIALCDRCLPEAITPELPTCPPITESAAVSRAHVEKKVSTTQPMVALGAKLTDIPSDPIERVRLSAALEVLGCLLYGESGALSHRLYESNIISLPLTYEVALNRSYAHLIAFASTDQPDQTIEALRNALHTLPERLCEDDFIRYKRMELGDFFKSLDSTEEIAINQFSYLLDGCSLFDYADALATLTLEDVRKLAVKLSDPQICASASVLPR